jgi:hypothetical protein
MRRHGAAWALMAFLLAGPAAADPVDYDVLDKAGHAAEAARLKIAPISALPTPARPVMISVDPAADHDVLPLAQLCAFGNANPVSDMVRRLVAQLPPSADASAPALQLRITQGRSSRRCVEVKELNMRCITRVVLGGEAQTGDQPPRPVQVVVERDASTVGPFCEGLARGTGIITREAAIQLLEKALAN